MPKPKRATPFNTCGCMTIIFCADVVREMGVRLSAPQTNGSRKIALKAPEGSHFKVGSVKEDDDLTLTICLR